MAESPTSIALIQMRCSQSPEDNWRRAVALCERARRQGARLLVLPELFQHRYRWQQRGATPDALRPEPLDGPTVDALGRLARRLEVVLAGGSFIETDRDGRRFNTAPLFDVDGRLVGGYRKSTLPQDDGFYEADYFARGDGPPGVFSTSLGKLGLLICYDQWFPELARSAALAGARLLIYPSAIGDVDHLRLPAEASWQRMWLHALQGHAAVNNVYVAAANRAGQEDRIAFWGGSCVVDPSSRLLVQAGCAEEIVVADLHFERVAELQEAWGFLREAAQVFHHGANLDSPPSFGLPESVSSPPK